MKCPNPECLFSGLEKFEETANFCLRCGWNLRRSKEASSSVSEKNTIVSTNSTRNASESEDRRFDPQDSTVVADGPCKETVEDLGKQKPGEITSSQSVLEDTTAVASQSLCHEKKTEENQEEDCDPTKEISHVSPSDSTLNLSCEEFASSNSPEDTLDDDPQGTVGSTAEAVAYMKPAHPSKTNDSSEEKKVFPVTDDGHKVGSQSMNSKAEAASNDSVRDNNTNDGENQFNRDLLPNDNGNSQSMDSHTGTVSSQCDNGSIGNNTADTDDVNEEESGSQKTVPDHPQENKPGIKDKAWSFLKSRSKKKREKKKERKKNREREKKEEAQREAAQNENKRQSSVSKPGPLQKEDMSDNVKKNNDISVPKKLECEIKGNHTENSEVENGGNHVGDNANSEYFWKEKGSKMTVVFHAVLAPHFNFSAYEGDKIYMRFGGPAFGIFNDDVVEVHPGRIESLLQDADVDDDERKI